MNHFLLTRFNVTVPSWKATHKGQTLRDDAWMENRLLLFKKYCLPSVVNQSDKNFRWLIYVAANTKENYKEELEKLVATYKFVKLTYVTEEVHYETAMRADVLAKSETSYVMTSRMDNDDLLHQDYIQSIQKAAIEKHNVVIDIPDGYQIIGQKEKYLCKAYRNSFNPFISLVEHRDQLKTVYKEEHKHFQKFSDVVVLNDQRLWIEFVHDYNMKNQSDYKAVVINELDGKRFGLEGVLDSDEGMKRLDGFRRWMYRMKRIIKR
ncbi:MAG: glycosyltransferase [Bacteroidota bacterium]